MKSVIKGNSPMNNASNPDKYHFFISFHPVVCQQSKHRDGASLRLGEYGLLISCTNGFSALQTLHKASGQARVKNHFFGGGTGATGRSSGGAAPTPVPTSGTGVYGGGGGGMGYLVVRNTSGQFAAQDGAAFSAVLEHLLLRKRARQI